MTFDEIALYDAVCAIRDEMREGDENPGSNKWDTTEDGRKELTQRVLSRLITNVDQRIINAWILVRKSESLGDGINKLELLIDVARMHGAKCFYGSRGKGDCSEDVHLDRIVPGSRGGQYTAENCVISCGRHNTMRGDMSIEEFLTP